MLSEQQLKNLIRKKARDHKVNYNQLYGLYAMERFLSILSENEEIKNRCILKGGFLLTSVYGLQYRATRDLDASLKGGINKELVERIATEVTQSDEFELKEPVIEGTTTNEIYQLKLNYLNGNMVVPISIDFSSDDNVYLYNNNSTIKSNFTEEVLDFPSYTIEQIVSDKVHTIMAYGAVDDRGSRAKDYYDVYLLTELHSQRINYTNVYEGIRHLDACKQTNIKIEEFEPIFNRLSQSEYQQQLWRMYCSRNIYSKDLSFDKVMSCLKQTQEKLLMVHKERQSERSLNNYYEYRPEFDIGVSDDF